MTHRRNFITLLGSAAVWPVTARAQTPVVPIVGFLRNTPSASFEHSVAARRRGLAETGFVEGRNVSIEQRWAEGRDDRLPALLADLVDRKAAVIVANTVGALAAKAAITTVPVVFTTGSDLRRDVEHCSSLRLPLYRTGRGTDLLRARFRGSISACGDLRRSYPERREASRFAGAGSDQIRAGN
jgi:hypothetical protein